MSERSILILFGFTPLFSGITKLSIFWGANFTGEVGLVAVVVTAFICRIYKEGGYAGIGLSDLRLGFVIVASERFKLF
jgi:hypothetical protein